MQDIADRAGVSVMTVSLALRDSPKISPATCDRIKRLAEQMGYRPNPLISALMANMRAGQKRTDKLVLGFVSAFSTSDHWQEIAIYRQYFEGAAQRANSLGFQLQHFWLGASGMTPERFSEILVNRGIPGLVICPIPNPGGSLPLTWERFASVALGYSLGTPQLHRACSHQFHAVMTAMSNLARLGYRRIGLCMLAGDDRRTDHSRIAPYLYHYYQVFQRPHLPIGLFEDWSDRKKFLEWVRDTQPDAIIATREFLRDWLSEAGIRVPEDIGLVLLDVVDSGAPCAGIEHRSQTVGATAIDLLIGQLYRNDRGIPAEPKTTLIEGSWVDGPTVREVRRITA
jgi:LacI family transcriptional regulator